MSQSTDLTLSNQSGANYRAEHNSINSALGSNHIGNSAPSYIVTGMSWINNSASSWVVNYYDGADNIEHGRINPTTNKFWTQANLIDSNGNEVLEHTATASAVNHVNITNAATGNGVTLQTAGGDTNVDLIVTAKGSGAVTLPKRVNFPTSGELTIASGAITASGVFHRVDTESNAASDDLDTITAGKDGQILIIRAENAARAVVIKHNTGNIVTPDEQDITLDSTAKTVMLQYDAAQSDWLVISAPSASSGASTTTGTFTPNLETDGGAFTSVTAASDVGGYYEKTGNQVKFTVYFSTTAVNKTGASGNVYLSGLPFTSRASTSGTQDGWTSIPMGFGTGWITQNPTRGRIPPSSTRIQIQSGSNGNITVSNVAGSGNTVYFSGFYFTE